MTDKECLELIEKDYPEFDATILADFEDKYYVNISYRKAPNGLADIHSVNKFTGEVSGSIPLGIVLNNEKIRMAIMGLESQTK